MALTTTTITNKYPGKCATCSCVVAAARGTATKTAAGWQVHCAAHGGSGATAHRSVQRSTARQSVTRCVYSGCRAQLSTYQVNHGFKFCSQDCARDHKTGGQSGYFGGQWHQGDND